MHRLGGQEGADHLQSSKGDDRYIIVPVEDVEFFPQLILREILEKNTLYQSEIVLRKDKQRQQCDENNQPKGDIQPIFALAF